jgi:hypothetical protein
VSGLLHLLGVLLEQSLVDLGGRGRKSGGSNEFLCESVYQCSSWSTEGKLTRALFPTSLRASQRKGFSKL